MREEPMLTRRQFLTSGGAAALATMAPGRLLAALERQSSAAPAAPAERGEGWHRSA